MSQYIVGPPAMVENLSKYGVGSEIVSEEGSTHLKTHNATKTADKLLLPVPTVE